MQPLISYLAELERIGWDVQPLSGDEVKVKCPAHEDDTPSCSLNTQSGMFSCKAAGCGVEGDFLTFMSLALKTSRAAVKTELSKRYAIEEVKAIEPSVIERYHKALWEQKHLLTELYLRGMTDVEIRKHRLGFDRDRITIPIKNDGGVFVNVRFYMPGAPGDKKMMNSKGRGQIRLTPVDQLEYPTIVVCGGEIKTFVAMRVLNPHGIGAITATAGEGKWHHSFSPRFKGKRVYVMMDVDEAGVKASMTIAALLRPFVEWISIVRLPLDLDKYPKGDVNDFVGRENGDLLKVIQQTDEEWFPSSQAPILDDAEPVDKRFSETIMSENVGRRMRFDAVVSAAVDKPFIVPKRVLVDCDKSSKHCALCAVFPKDEKVFHISAESPAILQMIDVHREKLDSAIRGALSIPRGCEVVQFNVADHFNAWDVRVNPSLEISNRDNDRAMQQAYCVECDADLNTTYDFTGRLYPHPQTQQATLLLSKSKAAHDALTKYVPNRLPDLRVFRPAEWTVESLSERLDDIYDDLETNVTKIFMRRDIHLFVDLAYHSALLIDVDGKKTKGWVEVLIVGDSSQGKTEVATTLMRHYGLGEKVECKNASVAGLLGGLKQMGTQWYVSWGIIPTHDRRLVIMEEMKGASVETIARLTDMRSSGIAEIPKIEKRRTHARTRLVGLSNPRGDRSVSSYSFGVEAIRDLIGAPEDVRRFDGALVVSKDDADPKEINRLVRDPPKIRHRYTGDLCRELILWAWTRREDQIAILPETSELISDEAGRLTDEFSDEIPLIDRGSTRHKLSRLATALACRTFSTPSDELCVEVRPCHAQYVADMLRRVYSAPSFGYKYFSEAVRTTTSMIDPQAIIKFIEGTAFAEELREQLLYADELDLTDIQDWLGWEKPQAQTMLSLLVRKRAVRRRDKKYYKTPEFIQLLKSAQFTSRPEHLKEKF